MCSRVICSVFAAAVLIVGGAAMEGSPFRGCRGSAEYKVTFFNLLSAENFGTLIPAKGLVYSPLAAFSHANRQSFLTVRGFANGAVEELAETGVNRRIIGQGQRLRQEGRGVLSVVDAGAVTMPGNSTTVMLEVDCAHSFVTVMGMIASSPDWIVQINNVNLFDVAQERFAKQMTGDLIAYDAGVDDGGEFTPPGNSSPDLPSVPQKNIAPLVEDETDRFQGRNVGRYTIERM